uniref:Vacuolar ATPase assembly protein VMA22 n=1 Tax=Geotrypetes seraphini TaxID=260995 RepID=A0A6P8PDA7_GEOSA|nr:coiled-coil domain-containing protein 115 [Geotrypetes seraphini]XP_033779090.1 coiled-coil domain-containing protein 115 [Geotrypetes seraphini]
MAGEDEKVTVVCQELDQLVLKLMSKLETLQEKRQTFNNLVEQGWLSLSQSRFAMGNKSVSSLQYGHQMTPSVHVCTCACENGSWSFEVGNTDNGERKSPTKGLLDQPEVQEIGFKEQVLRRRKGDLSRKDPPVSRDIPTEKLKSMRQGGGPGPAQDPLKWFGVLVPQSLRQAQNSFKKGLSLAVDIATLQSSIETIYEQYRALLEKKKQLLCSLRVKPGAVLPGEEETQLPGA